MLNLEVREEKRKAGIIKERLSRIWIQMQFAQMASLLIPAVKYSLVLIHIYTTDNVLKAKKHFANVHSRPRKSITMEPHIAIQTKQHGIL